MNREATYENDKRKKNLLRVKKKQTTLESLPMSSSKRMCVVCPYFQ
jgi:hypothetical protein